MTEVKENRLGAIIRKARKEKGITSVQLAALLSPPKKPQTVTAWERGISEPDSNMLSQICRILEIDARSFFHDESFHFEIISVTNSDVEGLEELSDNYRKMNNKQRKAVLAVASAIVE